MRRIRQKIKTGNRIPRRDYQIMRYDWVMLDADGTLFDYDGAEAAALERSFAAFGLAYAPSHLDTYRQINGEVWQALEDGNMSPARLRTYRFELLAGAIGVSLDPEAFSDAYLRELASCSQLIVGVVETVRQLAAWVRMLVITNGLREVQRPRLARSAIWPYMADVVISEEVGAAKPAPEIFDAAFEKMGRPARERVLIVGDSLSSDIQGGSDYGIDTCWFNPDGAPRSLGVRITYEIARLSELPAIVSDAGRRP